jgi:tetratricopeptide (TPR) repeat protein
MFEMAIEDSNAILGINPGDLNGLLIRGAAYIEQAEYDKAIQEFNQAIELYPSQAQPWIGNCQARRRAYQLEAALADCNEAVRLSPESAVALGIRGAVYFKLDRVDQAIADFDAALRVWPQNAEFLFVRGVARKMKGDAVGSGNDIIAATQIDKNIAAKLAKVGIYEDIDATKVAGSEEEVNCESIPFNKANEWPDDSMAKYAVCRKMVKDKKNSHFQFVEFKKTDGMRTNVAGIRGYLLYYDTTLVFTRTVHPECDRRNYSIPFDCWDYRISIMSSKYPSIRAGDMHRYNGAVKFEQFESGWKYTEVLLTE